MSSRRVTKCEEFQNKLIIGEPSGPMRIDSNDAGELVSGVSYSASAVWERWDGMPPK